MLSSSFCFRTFISLLGSMKIQQVLRSICPLQPWLHVARDIHSYIVYNMIYSAYLFYEGFWTFQHDIFDAENIIKYTIYAYFVICH